MLVQLALWVAEPQAVRLVHSMVVVLAQQVVRLVSWRLVVPLVEQVWVVVLLAAALVVVALQVVLVLVVVLLAAVQVVSVPQVEQV